ncbi:MAG: hypothetical protein NC253_05225 [Ruminococcus sp.]|nr:hypothetical protein [Ruminococcus sp.]MCM1380318.1 hypothetical protein [Muribaculaceae bacterium]MCM1478230.1 hypothetical protein [Muribaculaceae bacterium]
MGGRGASSGIGGGKLSSMTSEQKEDFMAAYNLSGAEFKSTHSINQAYDAAIKAHKEYEKSRGITSNRADNVRAVKGMELIQHSNQENSLRKGKAEHEKLRQEYLNLIKGQKGASYERQQVNLMPISNETLKSKIAEIKRKRKKK